MSQFDELQKAAAMIPQGTSLGYQGPPLAQSPREMNLTERVMTHDQRIALLEQQLSETRLTMEKLAQLLVQQLGLVIH